MFLSHSLELPFSAISAFAQMSEEQIDLTILSPPGAFSSAPSFVLGALLEVWSRLAGLLGKSIADPYTLQHEIRLRDSRHTNCCA